jgi:hypothetical protein
MTGQRSPIAVFCRVIIALALACFAGSSWSTGVDGPEFKGKIAERYEDSVEWYPQTVPTPPKGAPKRAAPALVGA